MGLTCRPEPSTSSSLPHWLCPLRGLQEGPREPLGLSQQSESLLLTLPSHTDTEPASSPRSRRA